MCTIDSSFPVIHEVDNVAIFVQLLMEINLKQLRTESISMQISTYQGALNSYWNEGLLYLNYSKK